MKLTNEQIQAILDGAPDGATHCADEQKGYYWECADQEHSLSDLREILTLRQEVERLKLERDSVCHLNDDLSAELNQLREQDHE